LFVFKYEKLTIFLLPRIKPQPVFLDGDLEQVSDEGKTSWARRKWLSTFSSTKTKDTKRDADDAEKNDRIRC